MDPSMMLEGKISLKRCPTWKKLRIFEEPSGSFQEFFHNYIIDGPKCPLQDAESFKIIVENSQTTRENRKIFSAIALLD